MGRWFAKLMWTTLKEYWIHIFITAIPFYFAVYILLCIMLGIMPVTHLSQ